MDHQILASHALYGTLCESKSPMPFRLLLACQGLPPISSTPILSFKYLPVYDCRIIFFSKKMHVFKHPADSSMERNNPYLFLQQLSGCCLPNKIGKFIYLPTIAPFTTAQSFSILYLNDAGFFFVTLIPANTTFFICYMSAYQNS